MLYLQTLGSLSLRNEDGDEVSAVLSQPKRLALLVYLTLAWPRGVHRRDHLLTIFWPERPETQARNALSQSLSYLRHHLPEPIITSNGGETVGVEPHSLATDVWDFEAAIEARQWAKALKVHRGDFLRGFHVGNARGFEEWAEGERERLRELAAGAAWSLSHEQIERGALVEAARTAQQALGLVWSDETPLRRFIESLARAGDAAAALNLYERFCDRLREELELEPSAQTEAAAEAIRKGELGAAAPGDVSRPGLSSPGPAQASGMETLTTEGTAGSIPLIDEGGKTARKRRIHRTVLWMVGAIATVLVSFAVIQEASRPELKENLVVVPPFENRTGEAELEKWAYMATEWVAGAVVEIGSPLVVPCAYAREAVAEIVRDGSGEVLHEVATRTGAGWVISGAIVDLGDSLEFRAEIIDATDWIRIQTVAVASSRDSPREAIRELGRRIGGRLAYEFDPLMEEVARGGMNLPMPPTMEAFREHRLGYEAYDREDWEASFNHHLAAYELDSTLVRAVVAAAYMTQDYSVKDSLAQFADERRHLLSRRGNIDLEILLAVVQNDLQGALSAMRKDAAGREAAFSAVTHAWAALVVNRPREAIESLSHFDPYPEWRRAGAHAYWDFLTQALHMVGDYEGELAEARAGREIYPTRSDLMAAEIRSLAGLGRVREVLDLLHEASGILDDPVPAMLVAGEELRIHAHFQESKAAFGMVIDWLNAMPQFAAADSVHKRYLADALYGSERWEEAHQLALSLSREAPVDVVPLGLVGSTAARLGDSILATEVSEKLATMAHPKRRGEHSYLRACIHALLDKPDEAMRLLRQAFEGGKRYHPWVFREMDLESLRNRPDYQALMRPKG
mgnify:CR=1 FL=1